MSGEIQLQDTVWVISVGKDWEIAEGYTECGIKAVVKDYTPRQYLEFIGFTILTEENYSGNLGNYQYFTVKEHNFGILADKIPFIHPR